MMLGWPFPHRALRPAQLVLRDHLHQLDAELTRTRNDLADARLLLEQLWRHQRLCENWDASLCKLCSYYLLQVVRKSLGANPKDQTCL